jgi:hypothetical protein
VSNLVALVGPSGHGKSTSLGRNEELGIKGLNPKETVVINVAGKPIPMKGYRKEYNPDKKIAEGGNYIETSDPDIIVKILNYINKDRLEVKNVVIEDAQYIMSFLFMSKAKEKGYEKFSDIAVAGFKPIHAAKSLRSDLNVIFTYHQEKGDDGRDKIKTSGKMIDNNLTLEGLFTVVLYASTEKDMQSGRMKYKFMTNTDGTNTAKSPAGMFTDQYIPNDMGLVMDKINEYYNG